MNLEDTHDSIFSENWVKICIAFYLWIHCPGICPRFEGFILFWFVFNYVISIVIEALSTTKLSGQESLQEFKKNNFLFFNDIVIIVTN